jgi:hypothetical protein
MKRMIGITVVTLGASLALSTLHAQQDHSQHQAAAPAKTQAQPAAAAAEAEMPEVFCGTMKTGQLCSHGTSSALGLTAEKAAAWVAAVRKYNRAVNEATVQLQNEAKTTLSPAQIAEVERWFAVGMNPQMNQLLAAPSKAKAATR